MNTHITKELFIKDNLSSSPIKNIIISALGLTMSKLSLQLNNMYFEDSDEIDIVLKNVKTRDIFIGESLTHNNIININLNPLTFMCTDNEFMLLILIKKDGIYSFINPIIKGSYHNISDDSINLSSNNIDWYLRTLENGEIRLSSIVKQHHISSSDFFHSFT